MQRRREMIIHVDISIEDAQLLILILDLFVKEKKHHKRLITHKNISEVKVKISEKEKLKFLNSWLKRCTCRLQ